MHCTLTRQQLQRDGYLDEFVQVWYDNADTRPILVRLYTPQIGEVSAERLTPDDRQRAVPRCAPARALPEAEDAHGMIEVDPEPPSGPDDCIFARTTTCVSADFEKQITPCQFGGQPDCAECGCIASAGLEAVGRHQLPGGLRVGTIFQGSLKVGDAVRHVRERVRS